ncbi:MAG: hypothetical protein ACLU9X_07335 [Alistipes shahii]
MLRASPTTRSSASTRFSTPRSSPRCRSTSRGRDDGTKYIVQLLDGNNALKQERRDVTTGDIRFNYVPAGEIKFRVIEDRNGNGKWDSGNVVERLQPERAEIYANDQGEDTFATKTNWEIEFSMDMNRIFAPVTMRVAFAPAGRTRGAASAPRGGNAPRRAQKRDQTRQPSAEQPHEQQLQRCGRHVQ